MSKSVDIPRNEQVIALHAHIQQRMKELRDELEDERLDDKPHKAIAARHRINELKDILDRFRFPVA